MGSSVWCWSLNSWVELLRFGVQALRAGFPGARDVSCKRMYSLVQLQTRNFDRSTYVNVSVPDCNFEPRHPTC